MTLTIIILTTLFIFLFLILHKKHMTTWLPHYLYNMFFNSKTAQHRHILFCFVDHYEPQWRTEDIEVERRRVDEWFNRYPKLARKHRDADGHHPKHSFFYPEEEYREEHLTKIQKICEEGFGEVEIHLHHHDDTESNFRKNLQSFKKTLREQHHLLPVDPNGKTGFAFIHGNWALDNSDPSGNNCGLNNEISILKDEQCYVDMTMPSAPHPTQTAQVNSIYMAKDNPNQPKSHNRGKRVEFGKGMEGDLLIIQGPLCLNWRKRKFGIMPKLENGDIRASMPPSKHRVDLWVKQNIHIKNSPEWVFVKIHTHGTQDDDIETLLGKPTDDMFSYLEEKYNDNKKYTLHYVSAREMYNIAKASSDGHKGNPNDYRDYYYKLSNDTTK